MDGNDRGHDIGAKRAPKKKSNRATKKDLEKALNAEIKRNSTIAQKLKHARADNKLLRESISLMESGQNVNDMPGHSTMYERPLGNDSNSLLMTSMNTLSMATLNIPECKPAENEEEIDRKSFEIWKELFEASMNLIGVTDETTKMNVLKVKAGLKLREVLDSTPHESTPDAVIAPYSNAIKRLTVFFGSREYYQMQRQKLKAVVQVHGEPDVKYIRRVIAAAKLCDYDDNKLVESVADIIQVHASNVKVREAGRKLLGKGGTLAGLIDKVRGYELDKINEAIFAKAHPTTEVLVAAVTHRQSSNRANYSTRASNGTQDRSNRQGRGNWQEYKEAVNYGRRADAKIGVRATQCWRCTSRFHSPTDCHAIRKICHNCQVLGHIERACRKVSAPMKRRTSDDEEGSSKNKIALVVKEDEADKHNVVSDLSS